MVVVVVANSGRSCQRVYKVLHGRNTHKQNPRHPTHSRSSASISEYSWAATALNCAFSCRQAAPHSTQYEARYKPNAIWGYGKGCGDNKPSYQAPITADIDRVEELFDASLLLGSPLVPKQHHRGR